MRKNVMRLGQRRYRRPAGPHAKHARTWVRHLFAWGFAMALLAVSITASNVHAKLLPNDVEATCVVTPGQHTLRVPPVPNPTKPACITITIKPAKGWALEHCDPPPNGWIGSNPYYKYCDGMTPGDAYTTHFSGKLTPTTTTGSEIPSPPPDHTFTVNASGSFANLTFAISPATNYVKLGHADGFTGMLNSEPVYDCTWNAIPGDRLQTKTAGRYLVTAVHNPTELQ
ncbi:MAG: hypothetical protein K9N51_02895, partial [Candidatus Pacebacteria bacterium]|nr:hypothetical protein [Candidatus Paceibacterota bacterium]